MYSHVFVVAEEHKEGEPHSEAEVLLLYHLLLKKPAETVDMWIDMALNPNKARQSVMYVNS